MKFTSVLLILLAASACFAQGTPLQLSPQQKEVWEREEAYCQYRNAGDLESFMSLWDDQFIGWPLAEHVPASKARVRQIVPAIGLNTSAGKYHCESTPLAVNRFGDIAITFYLFRVTRAGKDGKPVTTVERITHTWRKSGGKWLIIGGMSAAHEPTQSK